MRLEYFRDGETFQSVYFFRYVNTTRRLVIRRQRQTGRLVGFVKVSLIKVESTTDRRGKLKYKTTEPLSGWHALAVTECILYPWPATTTKLLNHNRGTCGTGSTTPVTIKVTNLHASLIGNLWADLEVQHPVPVGRHQVATVLWSFWRWMNDVVNKQCGKGETTGPTISMALSVCLHHPPTTV